MNQFKLTPVKAKKLLSHVKQPDNWFGLKYNMNLYRGCQHQCIYCDTRSECYQIVNFENEVIYKENALELLRKELASKKVKGTIGLGSMNDPYQPLEIEKKLTRKALEVIAEFKFPVHIITKSDLVLRDIDLLKKISKTYATVSFSITTDDDGLAKIIEPGTASVTNRLKAIQELNKNGIQAGIVMMPILPFIEDNKESIRAIVTKGHEYNTAYILPSFGMTMRDRQRDYFYKKLDESFPGIKEKYIKKFGNNYSCSINNYHQLKELFNKLCNEFKIPMIIPKYNSETNEQLKLF